MKIEDGVYYLDDVHHLIIEYTKELNRDLSFQSLDDELKHLEVKYSSNNGHIYVCRDKNKTVGIVAYHRLTALRCEMKRLYVTPSYRGQHIGNKLVEAIIEKAKQDGYEEMVLDTIAPLKAAISLYKKQGFTPCLPYYSNPMDDVIYMSKKIKE